MATNYNGNSLSELLTWMQGVAGEDSSPGGSQGTYDAKQNLKNNHPELFKLYEAWVEDGESNSLNNLSSLAQQLTNFNPNAAFSAFQKSPLYIHLQGGGSEQIRPTDGDKTYREFLSDTVGTNELSKYQFDYVLEQETDISAGNWTELPSRARSKEELITLSDEAIANFRNH